MSKIINAIKNTWRRLGEIDVADEISINNLAVPEGNDLRASMARINGIETAFKTTNSSTTPKGGKGNSIVEKAEINEERAMKSAEGKVTQRENEEKQI